MNTAQISHVLKSDKYTQVTFAATLPADMLPEAKIDALPVAYVVNTDPSTKPGTHWLAIYIDRKRQGYFMDSFGWPPSAYGFTDFFKRNCASCTYNERRLQSDHTTVCGQYCIYFILRLCRYASVASILRPFEHTALLQNDRYVHKIVEHNFRLGLPYVDVQHVVLQIARRFVDLPFK